MVVAAWVLALVGGALQVLGLLAAAWGVRETRREYDPEHPDFRSRIWARRPWRKPNVGYVSGTVAIITGSATGTVTKALKHEPDSVAHDLQILDERSMELSRDVLALHQRIDKEKTETARQIEAVKAELETVAKTEVRRLALDGMQVQAWGLVLTGIGVVLALVGIGLTFPSV